MWDSFSTLAVAPAQFLMEGFYHCRAEGFIPRDAGQQLHGYGVARIVVGIPGDLHDESAAAMPCLSCAVRLNFLAPKIIHFGSGQGPGFFATTDIASYIEHCKKARTPS